MSKIWIREDRETGHRSQIGEAEVFRRLLPLGDDPHTEMSKATEERPTCTSFAWYWPKPPGKEKTNDS